MPDEPNQPTQVTKNDGTDPSKNDDTPKELGATDRSCFMCIVNNLSSTITNVSLTHSSGDTNDVLTVPSMNSGTTSYQKQISYETGWDADFDYWNISFTVNGTTYGTPYNDRCNIEASDAGKTVQCQINQDGSGMELYVDTPVSDGCKFVIEST